jgi:ribonucleoside-triphosphate reductase (thioredoxin)
MSTNQNSQPERLVTTNGYSLAKNISSANTGSNGNNQPFVSMNVPSVITKRNGKVVPFEVARIEKAIKSCFSGLLEQGYTNGVSVPELARRVVNIMYAKSETNKAIPHVEQVQDIVEMVLQAAGEFEAAKRYILYRAEHTRLRNERPVPELVKMAYEESEKYFPTVLQQFQYFDKYSRFDYAQGRRETWAETVKRYITWAKGLVKWHSQKGTRINDNNVLVAITEQDWHDLEAAILAMRVIPSMRALAMAGEAADRSHLTTYNCSYLPVDSLDSFVETLIISMSGCGVGFSVERNYIEQLPRIQRQKEQEAPKRYIVADSADGWADALRTGLAMWFNGLDIEFDYSQIRPAGAPLKIKGGRASGPQPLREMLIFIRNRILARQGNFLRPIDAHDMMCMVGTAAVSGAMRRTALISLFDFDDDEMRLCKSGDFERENPQRWNANNSAVWYEGENPEVYGVRNQLTQQEFANRFMEMVSSERGEPGIFNRLAAYNMSPSHRVRTRTLPDGTEEVIKFGTNPLNSLAA